VDQVVWLVRPRQQEAHHLPANCVALECTKTASKSGSASAPACGLAAAWWGRPLGLACGSLAQGCALQAPVRRLLGWE